MTPRRGTAGAAGSSSWPSDRLCGDARCRKAPRPADPPRLGEEAAPAEEHDARPREEIGGEKVEQRGQPEEEGEAAHGADTQQVERARREDRHQVGRQDRAVRTLETPVDRRPDRLAAAYLVFESLEVDDVGVDRDTD